MEGLSCLDCKYSYREMEPIEEDYFYIGCNLLDSYGLRTGINVGYANQCKLFVKKNGVRNTRISESRRNAKGDDNVGD